MNALLGVWLGVLIVAVFIILARIERGPKVLDRAIAVDAATSCFVGILTIITAMTRSAVLLPVLVVIALVGFLSSVTISRFIPAERPEDRRLLTPEELRAAMAAMEEANDDDAPPVHDPDAVREVVRQVRDDSTTRSAQPVSEPDHDGGATTSRSGTARSVLASLTDEAPHGSHPADEDHRRPEDHAHHEGREAGEGQ